MTLLFKLLARLIRSIDVPCSIPAPKRILVVDLAFLGDMVMTSPVYRALKAHFPDAGVDALVFPASAAVLRMNPFVDRIYTFPPGLMGFDGSTFSRLNAQRYDLGIQVNTSARNNLLLWLIGARYRLGYDYRHRGCFHNLRVPIATRTARMTYRVDEEMELLEEGLGWPRADRSLVLEAGDAAHESVRRRLASLGVGDGDVLIGIHANPRQTREQRQWSREKFALLGSRLIETYGAKLIFTGTEADEAYVGPIRERIGRAEALVDGIGFSLEELAALMDRLDLFVTVNTGPMHLAIARKTPTVAIIGGTPARVVFPAGNPIFQYVMDKALEAWDPEPVHASYRPRIEEIEAGDVFEKAAAVMAASTGRRSARQAAHHASH